MALTIGSAPFTHPPGGTYNFDLEQSAPEHILYLEKVLKRIRGVIDGETVVDTRHGSMLHETGEFIQWYLPVEDVRPGVLERSDRQVSDPYKGTATYYHVRVGDHVESDAAWSYPRPPEETPPLGNLVAFDFDRLDAWLSRSIPKSPAAPSLSTHAEIGRELPAVSIASTARSR